MFGNRRGNTGMVSLIIATFLCFGVDIVLSEKPARCGMFEYYDSNMDNCGPCREICQHMELTRTEKQCRAQCSDYLTAATCTYLQYYDEVVQNCAPCAELCVRSDIKRTTKQCSSRCYKYLKAENCTEDEYFDETNTSCSACAQLCSQRDPRGDTTPECFHKCQKYLEKHPPGNIVMESDAGGDLPKGGNPGQSRAEPDDDESGTSSVHPGIIVTVLIGIFIVTVTIGVFVWKWVQFRRPAYTPAPSVDAVVGGDEENPLTTLQMDEDLAGTQSAGGQEGGRGNGNGEMGHGNVEMGHWNWEMRQGNRVGDHAYRVMIAGVQEQDPTASSALSLITTRVSVI